VQPVRYVDSRIAARRTSYQDLMTSDLHDKVIAWLHKTGYPLELRVGRRFQAAGWSANYSRWYQDLTSNKQRELDVQAIVGGVNINQASVFVSLCLECKTSGLPWIGLSSGQTLGASGPLDFSIGGLSRLTLIAGLTEKVPIPIVLDTDTPRVGGLVQALTEKGERKDETSPSAPYSALLQARSAALALDKDYKAMAAEVASQIATAAVFLPMVVLDGTLLFYSLEPDLHENLVEVDTLVVSVPGDTENQAALVPVVTERFAESMATRLFPSAHDFCVAMLPHARTVADALRVGAVLEPPTV
jgi:hypothetical protein